MVFEVANEDTCAPAMLHENMPALSVMLRHLCVLLRTPLLANTNLRLAGHFHAMPRVANHIRSRTHVGGTIRIRHTTVCGKEKLDSPPSPFPWLEQRGAFSRQCLSTCATRRMASFYHTHNNFLEHQPLTNDGHYSHPRSWGRSMGNSGATGDANVTTCLYSSAVMLYSSSPLPTRHQTPHPTTDALNHPAQDANNNELFLGFVNPRTTPPPNDGLQR